MTNLRDDVLIQPNAISAADLQYFLECVRRSRTTDSLVSNFDDAIEAEWVINREIRDTQEVHMPDDAISKLQHIHDVCVANIVNPFYRVAVRDREPLQLLHYGAGGHYIPHVDAETLYKDDIGLETWEKTLDRDLSVVYFLNDDFTGGELFFPALALTIQPQAGTLVCFPADHNFVHGVRPVQSGNRYTAVTWMRVHGVPTLEEINQMTLDEYESRWPQQLQQHSRLAKGGLRKIVYGP